jgi:3-hydroxybutyryl-CoA dehydrogenase
MFTKDSIIGIVGSGAMGSGIAQVASTAGHKTIVYDTNQAALEKAKSNLQSSLNKLVEKQKITQEKADSILSLTNYTGSISDFKSCDLVIEAIVEKSEVKQSVFKELESITSDTCVLTSNTSSLSITSIASACQKPEKVVGIHFFNPAALMPLVEIIPGVATDADVAHQCMLLIKSWGKLTVMAKDTPGFIVNRVARPFYSEALRIYDEQLADMATIDWAMRDIGGFKMGPFELMDLIGHDVNYVVTETVWQQFYYDPRFKPSLTQKRLLEAKFLGKKSGRGFYDYRDGAVLPAPVKDEALGNYIVNRILCMLINEACDTNYLGIASVTDIDLAMTKGVNYPKGLLKWADDIGLSNVLETMNGLYAEYEEDRYRACVMLKHMVKNGKRFY